jgi:hypothetical protein
MTFDVDGAGRTPFVGALACRARGPQGHHLVWHLDVWVGNEIVELRSMGGGAFWAMQAPLRRRCPLSWPDPGLAAHNM